MAARKIQLAFRRYRFFRKVLRRRVARLRSEQNRRQQFQAAQAILTFARRRELKCTFDSWWLFMLIARWEDESMNRLARAQHPETWKAAQRHFPDMPLRRLFFSESRLKEFSPIEHIILEHAGLATYLEELDSRQRHSQNSTDQKQEDPLVDRVHVIAQKSSREKDPRAVAFKLPDGSVVNSGNIVTRGGPGQLATSETKLARYWGGEDPVWAYLRLQRENKDFKLTTLLSRGRVPVDEMKIILGPAAVVVKAKALIPLQLQVTIPHCLPNLLNATPFLALDSNI